MSPLLCSAFKGDAFDKRVLPFFMHAMSDELAKRHSSNGVVEYGRFLLDDATVGNN